MFQINGLIDLIMCTCIISDIRVDNVIESRETVKKKKKKKRVQSLKKNDNKLTYKLHTNLTNAVSFMSK